MEQQLEYEELTRDNSPLLEEIASSDSKVTLDEALRIRKEKKREDIGETEKEVEDQSSQVWNSPLIFEEEKSDSPKAKPEPKPTNKMPSSGSENSFSFRSPSQRLENLERFYREKEVEECTFHPRINELPRSMATTFSPPSSHSRLLAKPPLPEPSGSWWISPLSLTFSALGPRLSWIIVDRWPPLPSLSSL